MSGWISVKNELPVYNECILILFDNKDEHPYIVNAIYRGEYDKDLQIFRVPLLNQDIECEIGKGITHWMPLPEPPCD
jgi:hypothetical protein